MSDQAQLPRILARQPVVQVRLSEGALEAIRAETPKGHAVEDELRLLAMEGIAARRWYREGREGWPRRKASA